MGNINYEYKNLIDPLNFFKGWSDGEFKLWLNTDRYGRVITDPEVEDLLAVLNALEPYYEYDNFYRIILITLKELNEKSKRNTEKNTTPRG